MGIIDLLLERFVKVFSEGGWSSYFPALWDIAVPFLIVNRTQSFIGLHYQG